MIYGSLLAKGPQKGPVKVGIIGAGNYGTAIITQSPAVPLHEVTCVADVSTDSARKACRVAGWDEGRSVIAETEADVRRARKDGKLVLTTHPALQPACDVEVLVEATGQGEAGAAHALAAFEKGGHVVMVNKKTDAVVGPLLHCKAEAAGLVRECLLPRDPAYQRAGPERGGNRGDDLLAVSSVRGRDAHLHHHGGPAGGANGCSRDSGLDGTSSPWPRTISRPASLSTGTCSAPNSSHRAKRRPPGRGGKNCSRCRCAGGCA